MDTNGRIRINIPQVVHETIDGETVILNLDNGNYYSLVGTGAHIWDYVEKGATVKDIIERLYRDYEAGREDIESEVNKFLSELMKEDLTTSNGADTFHSLETSNDQVETAAEGKKPNFTAPVLNKYTDMQDLLLLDPIHEVDEQAGWPNVDDKKGWPTRDPDMHEDN